LKIIIIGAGNVSWHLSLSLKNAGFDIIQIYSRTEKSAKSVAERVGADFTSDIIKIKKEADLYILAISDNVLMRIARNKFLKEIINNRLLVHTAGGVEMSAIKELSDNIGVLYPLQTLSKRKKVEFLEIPICLESNTIENLEILKQITSKISNNIRLLNSYDRKYIHLAAVFAANFTNHLYSMAEKILIQHKLDFEILMPLIIETAKQIKHYSPQEVQTGPAVRNDTDVMENHLMLLKNSAEMQEMYKFISKSIQKI